MTNVSDKNTIKTTTLEREQIKEKATHKSLPPAAQRALDEAELRRHKQVKQPQIMPKEINGRGGLEPTRYNDWEIKGLTSDF